MIVLRATEVEQKVYFLPRNVVFDRVEFIEKVSRVIQPFAVTPKKEGNYSFIEVTVALEEYKQYTFKVYRDDIIVYRDTIDCTNQDIDAYSINKDIYVEHDSNNDFIEI